MDFLAAELKEKEKQCSVLNGRTRNMSQIYTVQ